MGGLRYDSFDVDFDSVDVAGALTNFKRDDDMLSWRSGVVYKPRPQGSVYAAYGTSFNPSADGNTGLSLTSATVLLEPEKSRSARARRQVGAARSPRARDRRAVPDREDQRAHARHRPRRSADRARGPPAGARLRGRVQRPPHRRLDGVRRLHLPRERGARVEHAGRSGEGARQHARSTRSALWTTYRFRYGFELGGGAQFVGDRWNSPTNVRLAPSYWKLDATVAYPVNERLSLRLNAQQPRRRALHRSRRRRPLRSRAPGRSASISTDFRF